MSDKVRVRFAPSPTGPLHIGGVRTALFNYLYARHHQGVFILRIEDTDRTRYVPEAENYIKEALQWCGMDIDEGVNEGGPYAPYRQSERKDIYAEYAYQLVENGWAYYAFDTAEELDELRQSYEDKGEKFNYNAATRNSLSNSLVLPREEVERKLKTDPYVIRFKMPENEEVVVHDLIRDDIKVNTSDLDDKILLKADGMPTYHLANVVDDHLMNITHVIRGEEWVPSTPLHKMLYRGLGWENSMPEFAHIPLILKPAGKGKLSKRDGDKMDVPVFPLTWTDPETGEQLRGFREEGFFPDAFMNILALLGWNPGDDREILNKAELIEAFSLERVGKGGARFDPDKAKWINHQYLMQTSDQRLTELFQPVLRSKGIHVPDAFVSQALSLVKERAGLINELWDHAFFFFREPREYDEKSVKKKWKPGTADHLLAIAERLQSVEDFEAGTLKQTVSDYIEEQGLGFGKIMNPLRITLTGGSFGPDLFKMIEVLGKETSLKRIKKGAQILKERESS